MFCTNCGKPLEAPYKFCTACGQVNSRVAQQPVGSQGAAAAPALAPQARPAPAPAPTGLILRCIAGPDTGKAYHVGTTAVSLGRAAGLADTYVADNHLTAVAKSNHALLIDATSGAEVLVDEVPVKESVLAPGQQFRIGQSIWQVVTPAAAHGVLHSITSKLNQITSTEGLEGFSFTEMFSEVFKRRSAEEVEDYFLVGTTRTTPTIDRVQTGWPKPWFFVRVLGFFLLVYFGFMFGADHWNNPRLAPALMVIGASIVPLAVATLMFEMNTPRNVSLQKVITLIIFGGVVSLTITLFVSDLASLGWLGSASAGIIEEISKLLTVAILVREKRYKYILNGLLLGCAVGAGFAIFESAGYAFSGPLEGIFRLMVKGIQLRPEDVGQLIQLIFSAINDSVLSRGLLAPFGHVAWTAIAAAALWRVKGDRTLTPAMFFDGRFLRPFLIPVAMHMIWDGSIDFFNLLAPYLNAFVLTHWMMPILPYVVDAILVVTGLISWYIVFVFVQAGLQQVKEEQKTQLTRALHETSAAMNLAELIGKPVQPEVPRVQ